MLNKPNDGRCVTLLNPVTIEFQVARTSLLPGLLKTLSFNKVLRSSSASRQVFFV
jgi:phenylalanyl-tRNA synthetase beta chain